MNVESALRGLRTELAHELRTGILPYWMFNAVDAEGGGFVGGVDGSDARVADAPKGAILNARIAWTFSAAHRTLGVGAYRALADRAAAYLRARFFDPRHGGVFWLLDAGGAPLEDRKHVYAQAFAIYGLSEHFRATADERSLKAALQLAGLVEKHAADPVHGGYQEAFSRDWRPLLDVRLGDTDADEPRSMNTHLHLVEAYANLLRARPDARLRERTAALLRLLLEHVLDPATGHLGLFFDMDWTPRSSAVSFGHDIEASWLLLEVAELLGEAALRAQARAASIRLAEAVLAEGVDPAGGLLDAPAAEDDPVGRQKEWWPQAEALVGFVNAYELTGREEFVEAACAIWDFTRRHIIDERGGEWRRRVARDGAPLQGLEKIGPWKCPYHNGRACLEIIARVPRLLSAVAAG